MSSNNNNKKLPIQVLTEYLMADNNKVMLTLLNGLEPLELKQKHIVKTAVTCNLYKIIWQAGSFYSEYPEELEEAVAKLSFNDIDAYVKSLCETSIKKFLKNPEKYYLNS